jgi:enoyl-CoA hydratase
VADAPEYKFVTYETLDDGTIARIMLDREDARNAQNRGMLVELNDAFLRAEETTACAS